MDTRIVEHCAPDHLELCVGEGSVVQADDSKSGVAAAEPLVLLHLV